MVFFFFLPLLMAKVSDGIGGAVKRVTAKENLQRLSHENMCKFWCEYLGKRMMRKLVRKFY